MSYYFRPSGVSLNPLKIMQNRPSTSRRANRLAQRTATAKAFSIVELLIVLVALAAVATIAIPLLRGGKIATASGEEKTPEQIATETTLNTVRRVLLGDATQPGFIADLAAEFPDQDGLPDQLTALFEQDTLPSFDINTRLGWRGPYLTPTGLYPAAFPAAHGTAGDPAVIDAWSNAIILQWPDDGLGNAAISATEIEHVRLISAGPNGQLDTPAGSAGDPNLDAAERGDDLILFLFRADDAS